MKFMADSMLGKLAKWLRVLGYDTQYRNSCSPGVIAQLLKEERWLLSRDGETTKKYKKSVLIYSDRVKFQLDELRGRIDLSPERSRWFSRCLVCNTLLGQAPPDAACDNVPEYIFFKNMSEIRFCSSCGRFYWPGSHKKRMISQLEAWGFVRNTEVVPERAPQTVRQS